MSVAPKTELGKRVATAIVGVAAIIALLVYGGRGGILLFTFVVSLGMILEYGAITYSLEDRREKRAVLAAVAAASLLGNFFSLNAELAWIVAGFLALATYFLLRAGRFADEALLSRHFRELCYSVFGLLYLIYLPLYLPKIHGSVSGVQWTFLFLGVVWSGDTGAYFAGLNFGRRKLFPRVSPKKTVEGAVGGLLAGLAFAFLYRWAIFPSLGALAAIVISLMVGVVAPLGDLCESFLKRAFDKKDSGSLLPGHGGFLDRFDGVVFSLPVMYACMRFFS
jgi:phosphatidate cytidylyltransferase